MFTVAINKYYSLSVHPYEVITLWIVSDISIPIDVIIEGV